MPDKTEAPALVPPMKTYTAIDGPLDKPNRRRQVRILRPADMHGFVRCQDLDTGEILTTFRDHLLPPKANG